MDEITRLYYVRRTIIQMLIDRGYLVTANIRTESHDDFKAKFKDAMSKYATPNDTISKEAISAARETELSLLLRKKDDPTEQIFVFFPGEAKVGVKPIRTYCEKMKEQGVQRAIIVVQQGMTTFAKQALAEMSPKYKLEQFMESELLVNITEHQLVPKHIKLTETEKQALLQRYKLRESQLPRIQVNDPVARYYGLERGDVVKIIRPSETAGRYVTYRLVT